MRAHRLIGPLGSSSGAARCTRRGSVRDIIARVPASCRKRSFAPWRLALSLLLATGALAGVTAPARAANIPSYPPNCPAYMNTGLRILSCLINIPQVVVSVSPKLVSVGQDITVTVSPTVSACPPPTAPPPTEVCYYLPAGATGARAIAPDGGIDVSAQPLPVVRLLGSTDGGRVSTWKVVGPAMGTWMAMAGSAGWEDFPAIKCPQWSPEAGCGALGGEAAFFIRAKGPPYEVTGKVTAQGSAGQGVAGVGVRAGCPGGGTTTTDAGGNYSFVLNRGSCSISVQAPEGETALPRQRVVDVTTHDINRVNFELSCSDGGGQAADVASAAAAGGCLSVAITVQRSVTAGVGWRREPVPAAPEFIAPVSSVFGFGGSTTEEHCLQGCLNMEVKVTNKRTGKLVPGAKVTLSVTPFPANAIAQYPPGFGSGDGHLCDENQASSCGTHEITVATGVAAHFGIGVAQFLYWAPGAFTKQSVKFSATASAPCDSATSCPSASGGELHGTATPKSVTIAPNYVYTSPLVFFDHSQIQLLEDWAANPDNFRAAINEDTAKAQGRKAVLSTAISGLVKLTELAGEGALPLVGEGILLAEGAHEVSDTAAEFQDLGTEVGMEQAISALFLDPLRLIPAGLGDVNADELNPSFLNAVSGEDGLMRRFGLALREEERHGRLNRTDEMQLQLIDVSYCTPGGVCGPGVDQTPGIQPFIRFDFRAYNLLASQPSRLTNADLPWFKQVFVLPYDPGFFSMFQFKGKGPPTPEQAGQGSPDPG